MLYVNKTLKLEILYFCTKTCELRLPEVEWEEGL